MSRKIFFVLLIVAGLLLLSACELTDKNSKNSNPGLANPASEFCEENGGSLGIRTLEDGSQIGICVFPDGSECDEWEFFRGECQPGEDS